MIMNGDYQKAFAMALKVDFLKTKSEIMAYTKVLYEAILWGRSVK